MENSKREDRDPVRKPNEGRDGDDDGRLNESDNAPGKQPIGPGGSPNVPPPPKK
jgi:hypothetical protein